MINYSLHSTGSDDDERLVIDLSDNDASLDSTIAYSDDDNDDWSSPQRNLTVSPACFNNNNLKNERYINVKFTEE